MKTSGDILNIIIHKMANAVAKVFFLFLSFTGIAQTGDFLEDYIQTQQDKVGLSNLQSEQYLEGIRIYVSNYQIVELLKKKDSQYEGQLINYVTKVRRNEKPIKVIKESVKIRPKDVKFLLDSLFNLDLQHLKDSDEVDGYATGFDGKTYTFEMKTDLGYKIIDYWEPENENYQDAQLYEVKKVREILSVLRTRVSMYTFFKSFQNKLGDGRYIYGGILMKKG